MTLPRRLNSNFKKCRCHTFKTRAIILIRIITNTVGAKTNVKCKRYNLPVVGSITIPRCDCRALPPSRGQEILHQRFSPPSFCYIPSAKHDTNVSIFGNTSLYTVNGGKVNYTDIREVVALQGANRKVTAKKTRKRRPPHQDFPFHDVRGTRACH